MFSFLRSGVEAKRGVDFGQHAMPPELGGSGERSILTLGSLSRALLCAGYNVKLIFLVRSLMS